MQIDASGGAVGKYGPVKVVLTNGTVMDTMLAVGSRDEFREAVDRAMDDDGVLFLNSPDGGFVMVNLDNIAAVTVMGIGDGVIGGVE